MIKNIAIHNFKSVVNTSFPLSTFNVMIGANGCGKSNILEAIALAAASSANKLDYEYFANRGSTGRSSKRGWYAPQVINDYLGIRLALSE